MADFTYLNFSRITRIFCFKPKLLFQKNQYLYGQTKQHFLWKYSTEIPLQTFGGCFSSSGVDLYSKQPTFSGTATGWPRTGTFLLW